MNYHPSDWLVVHLYVDEPWETLLGQGIRPLVQTMQTAGLSDTFLFCRSWTEQPHLRLYFQGRTEYTTVQTHIERYFRYEFAHSLMVHSGRNRLTYHIDLFSLDIPPLSLPAGGISAAVSARYWEILSQVVLDLFVLNTPWSFATRMTVAMQLHLGFAWALGLNWAATGALYRAAGTQWVDHDIRTMAASTHHESSRVVDHLHTQQPMFDNYCQAFWNALQWGAPFDEAWLRQWLDLLQTVRQGLQPLWPPTRCEPQAWSLSAVYTHLINNQLGILPQEEVLLGQLLSNALAVPTI